MFESILKRQLAVFDIRDLTIVGNVDLRCIRFDDDFTTISSFYVRCTMYGIAQRFETLTDTSTDLASVPREVWSIVPPHRRIKRPAVFHDFLYQCRPLVSLPTGPRLMMRNEADALLYHACVAEGMSDEQCFAIYQAVRIGGSSIWHAHDAQFV